MTDELVRDCRPQSNGDLVRSLAGFPAEVERALDGRPREDLLKPASDGGWGVVENLCHLRDWEEVFLHRLHQVLKEDHPVLPVYDDELWAIERDYRGEDPTKVFEQFRATRKELVSQLEGLDDDGWNRTGQHQSRGDVSVRWLAESVLDHGETHLAQIHDALG
ncbi:MAG: DinB family protein [Chloroflexota bacterium]|nr:DinB family protein [Chloroflexota bacterium]